MSGIRRKHKDGDSKLSRHQIQSSPRKRKALHLLLEELTRPELDIQELSHHTTMMINQMRTQNVMAIPQILELMKQQSEPLVLEISNRQRKAQGKVQPQGLSPVPEGSKLSLTHELPIPSDSNYLGNSSKGVSSDEDEAGLDPVPKTGAEVTVEQTPASEESMGEKQFEIIFSDSIRKSDADSDGHIIHSTTERTAASTSSGTVNVPNSFPLFQIVHTGEVTEDVQQEIVRLIREANPELDLNSITFKFKSPQTVEIIANVNT